MEKKRIFVAIDISEEAKRHVGTYIEQLQEEFTHLRISWEKPEKLHLTLKFAGHIDAKQLAALKDMIDNLMSGFSSFKITLSKTGAFLKPGRSNVLWLGVEVESLPRKQNRFDSLVAALNDKPGVGIKHTKRIFKPHLTIARLKEPQRSKGLVEKHLASKFEPVEFKVSEIVIYESKLFPTGSVYTAISTHPLLEIPG